MTTQITGTEMTDRHEVDPVKIEMCVERVLGSRWFTSSPNLNKFLRYIVDKKLAGEEADIKGYSIAVDALGRPESFNAQTDPAVRIFAGRMRNALSDYYNNEGASDPVRIQLPKGRYVPEFLVNERTIDLESEVVASATAAPTSKGVRLSTQAVGLVAVGLLGLGLILYWQLLSEKDQTEAVVTPPTGPPILEVFPIETAFENSELRTVDGIRQQLVFDLAQFKSIRVRESSRPSSQEQSEPRLPQNAESYRLRGVYQNLPGAQQLNLTLLSGSQNEVVWAKSVDLPKNDADFHELLLNTSRSIAVQLVGETGVIKTDGLARLQKRVEVLGNENTSNYDCLLLFFAYDKSKSPSDETAARGCLTRLIDQDSRDSSIWASWALMQFLDWSKASESAADDLIQGALATARKAVRLDPTNSIAYEYLGSIQSALGDADAAMESYQTGVELNPSRPSLRFLIGWQHAVRGDWETGMPDIRLGVELTPSPPGYMRIPLSIDAFRRDDFQAALLEAEQIVESGDQRGISLALVASIGLGDLERVELYREQLQSTEGFDPNDPLKELRRSFSNPEILEKYQSVLNGALLAW